MTPPANLPWVIAQHSAELAPVPAVWVTIVLIAAATVLGAVLGGPVAEVPTALYLAVGVVLVVVLALDRLPDLWADLAEAGQPWWLALLAAAVGFALTGLLVRWGCACAGRGSGAGLGAVTGVAAGVAVVVHRAMEGAAVDVVSSVPIAAALVLHASAEGFALAALLRDARRSWLVTWTALACAGPFLGAVLLGEVSVPEGATALLAAAAAGVLVRIALTAFRLAASSGAARRRGVARRVQWRL